MTPGRRSQLGNAGRPNYGGSEPVAVTNRGTHEMLVDVPAALWECRAQSYWCSYQRHCGWECWGKGSTHKRATPVGDQPKERRATNPRTGRHYFLTSSMPPRARRSRTVLHLLRVGGRGQESEVSCPRSLLTRLRLVYSVDEARFVVLWIRVPLRSWRIRTSSFGSLAQFSPFRSKHRFCSAKLSKFPVSLPEARIKEVTYFFTKRSPPRSTGVTSFFLSF